MSDRGRTMPLAVLAVGSCAVIYATAFFDHRAASLMAIAGMLTFSTAYLLLRRALQDAADLPDERLDEREIAVRDRSYLEAYRLLGGAVAVSLVLALAEEAAVVRDAVGDLVVSWSTAWGAVLLLSVVLPSVVLAHRERAYTTAA